MEVCLLREMGGDNTSKQILFKNLKVICQQTLNKLYQPVQNTN